MPTFTIVEAEPGRWWILSDNGFSSGNILYLEDAIHELLVLMELVG